MKNSRRTRFTTTRFCGGRLQYQCYWCRDWDSEQTGNNKEGGALVTDEHGLEVFVCRSCKDLLAKENETSAANFKEVEVNENLAVAHSIELAPRDLQIINAALHAVDIARNLLVPCEAPKVGTDIVSTNELLDLCRKIKAMTLEVGVGIAGVSK